MTDFFELFNLQLEMFLLMGIGYFFRKKNIITAEGKKVLTDLIIYLILPCNIIESFCIEFNREILMAGFTTLLISVGIQVCCSVICATCYNKLPKRQKVILQYGTVVSNAGFLGNPLTYCIYGSLGLLYASIYCIPQRIVMWTAGISYFTESPDTKTVVKKLITHPCVVSCIIGMIMMITGYRLPMFVDKTFISISACITPITIMFIGAILSETGVKGIISRTSLLFSAIRLFIIPALTLIVCVFLKLDPLASSVCVLLAAMPAASMTAILASKYDGDEEFATKCVFLTTVLSMLFLPAWCMVLNYFL